MVGAVLGTLKEVWVVGALRIADAAGEIDRILPARASGNACPTLKGVCGVPWRLESVTDPIGGVPAGVVEPKPRGDGRELR